MWFSPGALLKTYMPTGLFPRSLLIIVMPVVVTQIVVAFVFMERHWSTVTQRLSRAVVSDISMLVDLRMREQGGDGELLSQMAGDAFSMSVAFLPGESLPDAGETPVVALLHQSLSRELSQQVGRPFWIDTATYDNYVDIRVLLPGEVMRVLAQRKRVYATNTHIFMIWMVGTSVILLMVSGVFLRNQIRPIQRLAEAAEEFGKGRDMPNFRPAGAAEVRSAASSFIEMRDRIERQIEQRTTMLAGVSHDLRTPLTRLKLQLAMLPEGPEIEELNTDITEMEDMLDDYLAFARGYQGETASRTPLTPFLEQIHHDAERRWPNVQIRLTHVLDEDVSIKPNAFRRCLNNLVNNACAHAAMVHVAARMREGGDTISLTIDDNGLGIPENRLEEVFRPFYRLDDARNAQTGGTGLGLAIARDVARGHGGDIVLSKSALGGLRAEISLPV
jgi:two-component system, OmpR family, osmolarity sensor histidine kinase EnvZ